MERRADHSPPANWQDLEDLCLKLWRPRLVDAKKNGRFGQPQAGVDIFGRDPKTEAWVGIQCKQKGRWPPKELTIPQIKEEIRKAARFKPPLSHFIVATTAPRDVEIQKFVRELSDLRRAEDEFSVDLFAWDDLQDWLQEGPEPISREKALWVWHQRILRLHSRLMPYFQERRAPLLEHVYVELQLDPERLPSAAGADLETPRLVRQRLGIRDVLDLNPTMHRWISRRWLLRGDPGAGKTTLLRHLAWTLADAGGEPWVPVFESLPRLMAERLSVLGRIEEDLERADQPGSAIRRVLEEAAEQGQLLFLLDGLDEVPREARDRAETLLSELAARWPKSPIVATTRPIGAWSPGPEFLELEVLPFDAERRRAFLKRWFGRESSESAATLEADRGLRELASNPLYLTLLALLIQGGQEPARYRSKLFDQIFDLLEEGRHHKPPTPIDNRELVREALCRLAYRMTEDNRDGESAAALERRLLEDERLREPLMLAWPNLRKFLEDVAEKTGILGAHDGLEADWRFWHRTFREALAAEALEGQLRVEGGKAAVLEHAREITTEDLSRWAEPYALVAGRIEDPDSLVLALARENRDLSVRALATVQRLKDETFEEVLEISEKWRHRQKVFERIPELIDDPIRALALVDQLRQRTRNGDDLFFLENAVATVAEKWPDAGCAAEQLQARLYDHIPLPSEDLFQWVETRDGPIELWRDISGNDQTFRVATVPVTIEQYAAFQPDHVPYHKGRVPDEHLPTHPVESVTWYQAFAFCRWLSTCFPWARQARLPTSEEWERACTSMTQAQNSAGQRAYCDRFGWSRENSGQRTHRVGQKPADPLGLFDVHGNVWEWTLSAGTPVSNEDGLERVEPLSLGSDVDTTQAWRLVRGGSSKDGWLGASSWSPPYSAYGYQGFRVFLASSQ